MNSELAQTVKEIALAAGIAIPNFLLLWKAFAERRKPDPQLRLIRNKASQAKVKVQKEATITKIEVQSEATSKKLQIEEAAIKEEVKHLARIKGIEIGVAEIEKKESVDLLSPWKEKGTNLVKDKVGSVSELKNKVDINKLTDLLNKKNKE